MRKLASIQKILELNPIPGKDRIELATIEGWHVIVAKDEFKVNDLCVYCEIDSVLPEREEFKVLERTKYRVKTLKLGGVISQGIVFPLSVLPKPADKYSEGDDVTDELGVTKYDPEPEAEPMERKPKQKKWYENTFLMRFAWFRKLLKKHTSSADFPTEYVKKTDEVRIQNAPWFLKENIKQPWILTEKVDGTSGTFLLVQHKRKLEYFVCSRNRRIVEPDDSIYWKVSEKYGLQEVLAKIMKGTGQNWACIQGECIGPGVQKNKYMRHDCEFYAFNVICGDRGLMNSLDAKELLLTYDVPFVPIVDVAEVLPETVDDMLAKAHGKSKLCKDTLREGLVCRSWDARKSFKAVDPQFLIKWDE